MITLTLDPSVGGCTETYEKGKDRIRRLLSKLRALFGGPFPWAWKLEFQKNGYAHWHLIVGYRPKISRNGLELIGEWWGLGRVNVKAIRHDDFQYLFKYVSKCAFSDTDESGIALPSWVLDYRTYRKDGRPSAGIRFWQTGGGFYQSKDEKEEKEPSEQRYSRVCYTIREQVSIWARKATAIVMDDQGRILASKQLFLSARGGNFFRIWSGKLIDGEAAFVDNYWFCRVKHIKEEIELWEMKHLSRMELLGLRRMTGFC